MAQLPQTGISTGLVGNTIGLGIDDVGLLCFNGKVELDPVTGKWRAKTPFESAGRINPNSANKPIIFPSVVAPTTAQIKTAKYGLTAGNFTTALDGTTLTITGQHEWTYQPPAGGATSPYNLAHFRLYNKEALPPLKPVSEVFWNISDGGVCPTIDFPYRYNASYAHQGTASAGDFDNMEIETESVIGTNASEYYACVIGHDTIEEPYLFVANAFEPLSRAGLGSETDAGVIDPKPFSIYKVLQNTINTEEHIHGLRHRLIPALNRITGRDTGYVMNLDTKNAKTSGDYNTNDNATHYNGAHSNSFLNMPKGVSFVDFYSYHLLGWMYGVTNDLMFRIATTIASGGLRDITMHAYNECFINHAEALLTEANYKGYVDLVFSAYMSNTGGEITIDGRTITKASSDTVTLNLSTGTGLTSLIVYEDSNGHNGAINYGLPHGYAWKNVNDYIIYTIMPAPDTAHNIFKEVYGANGAYLGLITNAPTTDTIVFSGSIYTYTPASDITKFTVTNADGVSFGMYKYGAYPAYGNTITLGADESALVYFRLRGYPQYAPFGIYNRTTQYLFDFIYNAMPASPMPSRATYTYLRA